MKYQGIQRLLVSTFGILAFSFFTNTAISAGDEVAAVNLTPSAVYWQPHGPYAQITLTISGPVGVTRTTFSKGTSPVFQATGDDGQPFVDGSYNYELTVTPVIDDATRATLRAARESGDMSVVPRLKRSGALPSGPTSQSGHFRILNGAIYVDTTPEG